MDQDNKDKGGIVLNVYSPGNQFIHSQINNYYGTVYQGGAHQKNEGFTDEHIRQALVACAGKDKVINNMRKWAGVYWCLRWKCSYPVDIKDFCQKIDDLKLGLPEDLKCDYNNIRKICKLSFMDCDPFGKAEVKVSNMDRDVYAWCREVALKLAEELGKSYLPRV